MAKTPRSALPLLKVKNPSRANKRPKKTQGHISIHLAQISGKNPTFPLKNPTFPEKILSAKISDDLFIFSHQLRISNFTPVINFQPFSALNLLLIPYFKPK